MVGEITQDTSGKFTWDFGQSFFIETEIGNFIWNDPDYGGDNTLSKTDLTYQEWIDPYNEGLYGRDKGTHFVLDYCGPNVKIT